MSERLYEATHYLMDRWLDDSQAKINLAEIRQHLVKSASFSRDEHLDAEMDSLITVLQRCDGLEVDAREVSVKDTHSSLLRKLFQTIDGIVDAMSPPSYPPRSDGGRAARAQGPTRQSSVLDQLDEELASQRWKRGHGRS